MANKYTHFYYRLATLLESGIAIREAFLILGASEDGISRNTLENMVGVIDRGGTLEDVFRQASLFPEFEIQILSAGDKGGRLPEMLKYLVQEREKESKRILALIASTFYPLILIHAAILLPNLVVLVQSGLATYLKAVLPVLAVFYACILVPLFVFRLSRNIPSLRFLIEMFLFEIPLFGNFLLKHYLFRSFTVFYGLYHSGLPMLALLDYVIKVTTSPTLRPVFLRIRKKVQNGSSLRDAVIGESILPPAIRDLLITGEISGRLDQTLQAAQKILEEESDRAIKSFIVVLSILIFLGVATWVGYKVISMYLGYIQSIMDIMPK